MYKLYYVKQTFPDTPLCSGGVQNIICLISLRSRKILITSSTHTQRQTRDQSLYFTRRDVASQTLLMSLL